MALAKPSRPGACDSIMCMSLYRIPLLNAERRAVSSQAPEEKSAQIGHGRAHKCRQFRVRAGGRQGAQGRARTRYRTAVFTGLNSSAVCAAP